MKSLLKNRLKLNPKKASLSKVTKNLGNDSFDDSIIEGFELYILIKILMEDENPEALNKYQDFEAQMPPENSPDSMHRSLEFYKQFTRSCEVVVNGDLFRVYFPIMPICRFLTPETKMNFLINVKRISPQHKINGLISEIPNFIDEMEHYEKFKSKIWPMTKYLRDTAYLVSIVLNFLILTWYKYVVETQSDNSTKLEIGTKGWAKLAVLSLGIAQISINSLMLISWLVINFSLMNKKSWRDYIQYNRTKVDPEKFKVLESKSKLSIKAAKELPLREAQSLLLFYGKEAKEFNLNKKVEYGHLIVWIEYH